VISADLSEAELAVIGRMTLAWPWLEMAGHTLAQACGQDADTVKVMSRSGEWLRQIKAALKKHDCPSRELVENWLVEALQIKVDRESVVNGFLLRSNKRFRLEENKLTPMGGETTHLLLHWRGETDRPVDLEDIRRLALRVEAHVTYGVALAAELRGEIAPGSAEKQRAIVEREG
jgi:hypothetical protein